jgi:hypothetical protein
VRIEASAPWPERITLERENDAGKHGWIAIDLKEFRDVGSTDIVIGPLGVDVDRRTAVTERRVPCSPEFVSPPLVGGLYRVTVRQHFDRLNQRRHPDAPPSLRMSTISREEARLAPVWSVDASVEPGMVLRLRARAAAAAGVRVRIMGDGGEPCHPAVISTVATHAHPWGTFDDERHPDGWDLIAPRCFGFANQRGEAVVYGIEATTGKIMVQAPGYERAIVPVSLNAGAVADIGTIQLKRAIGVIDVYIERDDGTTNAEYTLWLNEPYGARVRPPQVFRGNHIRIDNLELLLYSVLVTSTTNDVRADASQVELSHSKSIATITVKMSATDSK